MRRLQHLRITLVAVGAGLLLVSLSPASASSANLSHSYRSNSRITLASIVSLDPQSSDYVEASNIKNGARIIGVVVASKDSLLAVDVSKETVQVATTGTATVLVSDLNGPVGVGDEIAVSPFDGVGMKAGQGSRTIGLAQSPLVTTSGPLTKQTVTDTNGVKKQITIGYVRINIAPGTSGGGGDASLSGLQKFVRGITGKTIPTTRIVIALIVLAVTVITLVVLIYGSIYSTIISIGRNPLAKFAVFRSLSSVLAMAGLASVVAGVVIVLLLR
ncbi:MAG: hypothetical protein ABIV43_02980 [Candidatus Saccharimonadales bacterium]